VFKAGYAYAAGILVILVGKRERLTFLELPHIKRFSTMKAAIRWARVADKCLNDERPDYSLAVYDI